LIRRPVALLLLALLTLGVWLLLREPAPCSRPIAWDVGEVDPRHGISRDAFLAQVQEAVMLWETASGRDLFVYSPGARLHINLVYDERQAEQDRLLYENTSLSDHGASLEEERMRLESLRQQYAERLATHNSEVALWNQQGGAPPDVFRRLRRQEMELRSTAVRLDRLNERFETSVDSFNARVERYNQRAELETIAGQAVGRGSVDIFLLQGEEEASVLIAHELGHVLGLGHLDDETALMYFRRIEGVTGPGAADLLALERLCGGR
jgi:hypothetical protein